MLKDSKNFCPVWDNVEAIKVLRACKTNCSLIFRPTIQNGLLSLIYPLLRLPERTGPEMIIDECNHSKERASIQDLYRQTFGDLIWEGLSETYRYAIVKLA